MYTAVKSRNYPSLAFAMHCYRRAWIRMAISRENRIADTNIIAGLERSVSFFASSTLLIIVGLVTVLGSSEEVAVLLSDIPFSDSPTHGNWEAKVILLICVFVFAFFKFTWSLRQYGFLSVMIGAARVESPDTQVHSPIVESSADVASNAAANFNNGLRSYYFSLAILGWFINAWAFIVLSTLVVPVLYRREFKSKTLKALLMGSEVLDQNLGEPSTSAA